jgi:hypothetical protein
MMAEQADTRWAACAPTATNPPHVYPLGDLRDHTLTMECWCHPTDDEGVMVHHSMDRREEFEEGRRLS